MILRSKKEGIDTQRVSQTIEIKEGIRSVGRERGGFLFPKKHQGVYGCHKKKGEGGGIFRPTEGGIPPLHTKKYTSNCPYWLGRGRKVNTALSLLKSSKSFPSDKGEEALCGVIKLMGGAK